MTPPQVPDSAVHRGREAVMRDWRDTFDSFEDFSVEVEECHDLGDDLLVFVQYRGLGRGSRVPVEVSMAHVLTVREGRLLRLRRFLTREEAVEAAELEE